MAEKKQPASSKTARVNRPERLQVEMQLMSLDQMLPSDHRARIVWKFVESLDLEPLYQKIRSREGNAGRNPIAPEILFALWLLATLDSISSAREVRRRCESDIAYMWICGGVSVNYHTLSDFRSDNAQFFEKILTDSITALIHSGLVSLETIAQDGMRVRANAGSSSFRRLPSLEKLHQKAQKHVDELHQDASDEDDDDKSNNRPNARQKSARKRAAQECVSRLSDAIEQVKELRDRKEKRKKGDGFNARCSSTDPDARRMKMPDGGTRPAYNFQFATDGGSRMIVAVDVTNSGSDRGLMSPMHKKVVKTYQITPKQILVDSAFATKDDVEKVQNDKTKVVSTIPRADSMELRGLDPYARQPTDNDQYAEFRTRMKEPFWQTLYKQRAGIAEYPNAECRNRGCRLLRVRGAEQVRSVALLHAVTFNLLRMAKLMVI